MKYILCIYDEESQIGNSNGALGFWYQGFHTKKSYTVWQRCQSGLSQRISRQNCLFGDT